jgi:competence protein ComEC
MTLVLSFFLRPRLRLTFGLIAIVLFALMVGLSATVIRASAMAALALIANTFGRQYLVLRALVATGVAMVIWNPFILVYDIGFQFSFMATLGLILVAPQLETALVQGRILTKAREYFIATVAAQVAVMPLLLYHIGEISLVAVVVNVLVLPIVPLAMGFTFVTGVLAVFSTALASLLAYPTTLVLSYVTGMANAWAGLDWAALPVPAFSFFWVVVAYGILGYCYYRWGYVAPLVAHPITRSMESIGVLSPLTTTDWTIEEEVVVKERIAKTAAAPSAARDEAAAVPRPNKNDLPVFFR